MSAIDARPAERPASEPGTRALPLENGDRLTRTEFERRYSARPGVKQAELIEGVVHMPSPVKVSHGRLHGQIMTWLGAYGAATPGVDVCDNTTVRLDLDNEVQPDALLRLEPAVGGRSRVSVDDYVEGPPELIVEVAASSAAIDLHGKLNVYRRNGVPEYLVWQIYERRIDWFELRDGEYIPLAATAGEPDVRRSRVFPGLWLAAPALLAGDLAGVLAKLQQGLASADHTAFAQKLESAPG